MSRPLVYVCDDSQTVSLQIRDLLKSRCVVCGFSLPSQLLPALRRVTPDVLVLDVSLPERDAFDLLGSDEIPQELPVVCISISRDYLAMVTLHNQGKWHRPVTCLHKRDMLDGLLAEVLKAAGCDNLPHGG